MGTGMSKHSKTSVSAPNSSTQQRALSSSTHQEASTSYLPTQLKDDSKMSIIKTPSKKFALILDQYETLDEVTQALRKAGLESSNLIVGIDFTKSNEWTGKFSFNNLSLHTISGIQSNPYEQALSIIGETLSKFDEDNLIPCFGFGDVSTHDHSVFHFNPDGRPCNGFLEALERYREIAPKLQLSGPTSFAPVINSAIGIVEKSGGQYHVLVIIADGQVTQSINASRGELSIQERGTIDAIVQASQYPLSIVLVGVGDGPWEMMEKFDDNIPQRVFDNFQFVNFTRLMSRNLPSPKKEAAFALAALMEIPLQYQATAELKLLHQCVGTMPKCSILPPLPQVSRLHIAKSGHSFSPTVNPISFNAPLNIIRDSSIGGSVDNTSVDSQAACPICLSSPRNLAFGCGHQTCWDCGQNISHCPLCRKVITTRLKLYL